jgi:probable F420-dependent oxidoreductase
VNGSEAMRFGILPPYRTGVVADPAWMVAFAQHAEGVGFESLYVVEHAAVGVGYASSYPYASSGRMPLPEDCPIPDPLELLGFLAAHTRHLVLGTGILVLPLHQPVVLAKRLATLDVLSGGRVRLGVGVGWMREEIEAVGTEFRTRGRRMDEAIVALRTLWSDGPADHHGEFFSFGPLASFPKPMQPGGVPIHVGGHSPAAARRAGRLGDGYFPLGLDEETLRDRMAQLRTAARAADRDPDAVELTVGGLLEAADGGALDTAVAAGAARMVLSTTTDDLDELRRQMDTVARLFDR